MNNKLFKGTIQTVILKMLSEETKMYGYQMTQKAKELTENGLQITEGALYPTLHKMESEGTLTSESKIINGRVRKYYFITEKGKTILEQKLEELNDFIQKMQEITQLKPIKI